MRVIFGYNTEVKNDETITLEQARNEPRVTFDMERQKYYIFAMYNIEKQDFNVFEFDVSIYRNTKIILLPYVAPIEEGEYIIVVKRQSHMFPPNSIDAWEIFDQSDEIESVSFFIEKAKGCGCGMS
jgi:hypothetical protein